jgi:hypothetical protein
MSLHFAYLDAGTGSIVIQAVVGTALGVTYALRNFSKKFFKLNRLLRRKNTETGLE